MANVRFGHAPAYAETFDDAAAFSAKYNMDMTYRKAAGAAGALPLQGAHIYSH